MAWDDKPPTTEELSASSWDATPPTSTELKIASKAGAGFEPKTFAGKALSTLESVGKNTFLPSMIKPGQASVASLPIASGLESMGNTAKDSAYNSFNNIIDSPLPKVGNAKGQVALELGRQMAKSVGGGAIQAAPFTPSGFEELGSALFTPLAMTEPTKMIPQSMETPRPSGIAPKYAKATMEGIIPSSADDIRMVDRMNTFGKEAKTTAEKVLDRPDLGNTRAEIKANAQKQIGTIQGKIQKAIDSAKDVQASKDDFISIYDDALNELKGVPNRGKQIRAIEKMAYDFMADKNVPETQSLPEWDQTRAKLNKDVGKKGYMTDKNSVQVDLDKRFADKVRDLLPQNIKGIKELRREQGDLMEIRDSIINSSPKEVKSVRPYDPFMEEAAVRGSKFLVKKRQAPSGIGMFGLMDQLAAQDQP